MTVCMLTGPDPALERPDSLKCGLDLHDPDMSQSDLSERSDPPTVVYTDGSCLYNPGPGGWAWAIPGGRYRSGCEAESTNQRMELAAVIEAARSIEGSLEIRSDSSYVVNCFKDGWWEGWLQRGWVNTRKKPVANRDLWEPLVDIYRTRNITFSKVRGHSGNRWNDLVDELARRAATHQEGQAGERAG